LIVSLIGSEGIAAFLAAKIVRCTVVLVSYGLLPGHEFFTNRVFFQGVADRHLPERLFLPAVIDRWLFPGSCYQPEGKIDQDGDDDYP
jgi:hypothetical protein